MFTAVSYTLILTTLMLTLARVSAVRAGKGYGIVSSTLKPLGFISVLFVFLLIVNKILVWILMHVGVTEDTATKTAILLNDVVAISWLVLLFQRALIRRQQGEG